jgi:hypothetical protein
MMVSKRKRLNFPRGYSARMVLYQWLDIMGHATQHAMIVLDGKVLRREGTRLALGHGVLVGTFVRQSAML